MSHKIKIKFKDNKTKIYKNQKDLDYKISINLGEEKKSEINLKNNYEQLLQKTIVVEQNLKPQISKKHFNNVFNDKELHKLFKKKNFSKLDLHGQTLEGARKTVLSYCEINASKKNILHIIITGLGNKSNQDEFFSGKIRSAFTQWIHEDPIQNFIHSYYPCKIQHGGLGAFYIKIRPIK
ncbi:MAG: Smr/MutS family protein [Proteobacteria bacterium]|nr:Smr/MutS family protein [Pseudomonadota bacterium]